MGVQIGEAITLTLIGMGVVFSSLVVLYLVMVLIARLVGRAAKPAEAAVEPKAAKAPQAPHAPHAQGIDPEVVAAISAAVRAGCGPGARPRTIRIVDKLESSRPAVWALAGRQTQMTTRPGSGR